MQSGQLLCNRYSIDKALASGGFGQTYLAYDTHLPSTPLVVVKLLKPSNNDPATLQIAQRLFMMEAEMLEQLGKNDDRIPSLYAHFESDGEFYLVQEFIAGATLTEEVEGKKISESETLAILKEILTGLNNVHSKNIIHRDLKPDNIIRRASDGKLVLIDFGAVKQIRLTSATVLNSNVSQTIGIGTPGYMPTEQSIGYPKPASDIYAVGAIGIQCLTGSQPSSLFNEDTLSIEWQHLQQIDRDFASILNKMVAPDYRQRYANATEALNAIELLITHQFSPKLKPPQKPTQLTVPISAIIPTMVKRSTIKNLQTVFTILGLGCLTTIGAIAINYLNSKQSSTQPLSTIDTTNSVSIPLPNPVVRKLSNCDPESSSLENCQKNTSADTNKVKQSKGKSIDKEKDRHSSVLATKKQQQETLRIQKQVTVTADRQQVPADPSLHKIKKSKQAKIIVTLPDDTTRQRNTSQSSRSLEKTILNSIRAEKKLQASTRDLDKTDLPKQIKQVSSSQSTSNSVNSSKPWLSKIQNKSNSDKLEDIIRKRKPQ